MNQILRLLFQFQSEYSGDPRFISGNAFRHALSQQVNASIGIFTDLYQLRPPKTYYEFFLIRTKKCFAYPHFEKFFDKNSNSTSFRFFCTPRFVTFDILAPPSDLLDTIRGLEPLQFGGCRHSGYGAVTLHDSLYIDLDKLPMPDQASHLTLISPMIHLPPFVERYNCRREQMNIWNNGHKNQVEVIAPGQFFRVKRGKDIPKLAKKGILRKIKANKALFSQFGFGEFMLNDWKPGEVENGPK
ncbi:MAG: hypothetical protein HWN65_09550 [Candidatus Helarchaeota archaeon]|nr:hypothetical protein [Candidatus Helarchaeota archaeon]